MRYFSVCMSTKTKRMLSVLSFPFYLIPKTVKLRAAMTKQWISNESLEVWSCSFVAYMGYCFLDSSYVSCKIPQVLWWLLGQSTFLPACWRNWPDAIPGGMGWDFMMQMMRCCKNNWLAKLTCGLLNKTVSSCRFTPVGWCQLWKTLRVLLLESLALL